MSCGFIEFEGAHECAGFDAFAYDDGFQCARIIFGTDFYRLGISGAVCRWFGSIEGIVDGCIALCAECRFYTAFGFIYRVFAFNFEYMFGIVEGYGLYYRGTGHNFCFRLDPIVLRSVLLIWEVSCIRGVRE